MNTTPTAFLLCRAEFYPIDKTFTIPLRTFLSYKWLNVRAYTRGIMTVDEKGVVTYNGKQHFAIGLVAWFLICSWVHVPLWAVLLGSVLPDCDHPRAPMGKIIPAWLFCKHRGVTHSVQAVVVVFGIVAVCIGYRSGLGVVIGYTLHLLMDATTPSGVRWWWTHRKATPRRQ